MSACESEFDTSVRFYHFIREAFNIILKRPPKSASVYVPQLTALHQSCKKLHEKLPFDPTRMRPRMLSRRHASHSSAASLTRRPARASHAGIAHGIAHGIAAILSSVAPYGTSTTSTASPAFPAAPCAIRSMGEAGGSAAAL